MEVKLTGRQGNWTYGFPITFYWRFWWQTRI